MTRASFTATAALALLVVSVLGAALLPQRPLLAAAIAFVACLSGLLIPRPSRLASTLAPEPPILPPTDHTEPIAHAAFLNALPDPAILLDDTGQVLAANPPAHVLIATGPLVGRRADEVFTRADLADVNRAAPPRRWTARMCFEGQERWIEAASANLQSFTLLILRDVHDAAEAARVRTEFVANASHELRTPIAAIRAGLETLDGPAAADPATAARVRQVLLTHADRLESIVGDLLRLADVERTDIPLICEPLDPETLERRLREDFTPACERKRLQLRFEWGVGVEGVPVDQRLVLLALRNLVENATAFAYENTPVVIASSRGERAWRIEVRDRGVGIPVAHQARVFERFYQVDSARPGGRPRGAGLGLAIVRHAVSVMGGDVFLESVWKEGTTVRIELPLAPPTSDPHTDHTPNPGV